MHHSSLLVLLTTATLGLSISVPMYKRAGGPAAKPIPSECTLSSLTPDGALLNAPGTNSGVFSSTNGAAFAPSTDFRGTHTSYSYFLEDDSDSYGWDENAKIQMCLEQCYGFGGPCKGVAWGHNVWGDPYGHEVNEVGCLFLDVQVQNTDLASVTNGSWTGAVVVDINCPNPKA